MSHKSTVTKLFLGSPKPTMVSARLSCTLGHWLGGYRASNGILTSALKSRLSLLIVPQPSFNEYCYVFRMDFLPHYARREDHSIILSHGGCLIWQKLKLDRVQVSIFISYSPQAGVVQLQRRVSRCQAWRRSQPRPRKEESVLH